MDWKEMTLDSLEWARKLTLMGIDGLTDQEMMFQPKPGLNHALWLLGHIAESENGIILGFCKGENLLPAGWHETFGIGSQPKSDPKAYPSRKEILALMEKTHIAAIAYIQFLSAKDLDRQPPGIGNLPERARQMFATVGRCLQGHIRHESSHAGQIGMLRRLMGRAPRV